MLILLCAANVVAQQPNSPAATLTFNSLDEGVYPIQAQVFTPGSLEIRVSGDPVSGGGRPFILIQASDQISPGIGLAPGIVLDIDPFSLNLIMDGTQPGGGLLNAGAFTDPNGEALVNFPINFTVGGPTLVGGFQAAVIDPTQPNGFALSAATRLSLIPTPNYGTAIFSRGGDTGSHEVFSNSAPGASTPTGTMPSNFDVNTISLAGFQMYDNAASHPWWKKDLASVGLGAATVRENSSFAYIKTQFGDLYFYEDNGPSVHEWGFALMSGGTLQPIASTVTTGNGTTGTSAPIESEIAVDANRLAFVRDPSLGPDRLILSSLDGATLSGGAESVDISPSFPPITGIAEESLTFTTNNLLAVANVKSSTPSNGLLFSAPRDGSAAASFLALPPVTVTGAAPTHVDGELRLSDDGTTVLVQAGNGTSTSDPTVEDLYWVQDTGAGTFTTINLTQFPAETTIEEFGDESDGGDNQAAISPNNDVVAFVVVDSTDDELYIVNRNNPGVLTHVTDNAVFDATIDDVVELHWLDDNRLLFFAGVGTTTTDAFVYDVAAGTVTNVSGTNGAPGVVALPALIPSGGTIDPEENFFNPAGTVFYFWRDAGTDALANSTKNLIALDVATLALTDITGDEFSAGTAPHAEASTTASTHHLHFAKNSSTVVFIAEIANGTDDNVFAFNGDVPASANMLSANMGASAITVDNASLNPAGTLVVYSDNGAGSNEEIYGADPTTAGSGASLFNPIVLSSGDVTDGTLRWSNDSQLLFGYGQSSTSNPTDATIFFLDATNGLSVEIDNTLGSVWIYQPRP